MINWRGKAGRGWGGSTSDSDYSVCIHMHEFRDFNCTVTGVPSSCFPPARQIWGLFGIWLQTLEEADLVLFTTPNFRFTLGTPVPLLLGHSPGKGRWARLRESSPGRGRRGRGRGRHGTATARSSVRTLSHTWTCK